MVWYKEVAELLQLSVKTIEANGHYTVGWVNVCTGNQGIKYFFIKKLKRFRGKHGVVCVVIYNQRFVSRTILGLIF